MTGLRRSKVIAGLAVVGLMVGGVAAGEAQAQQRARGARAAWGQGPMGRMSRLPGLRLGLAQLNLTPEQREKVKAIVQGHRAETQSIRDRAVPARRALADAIASGDEAAIRQRSAEVGAVQTDRALLAGRIRNEIFNILTPEQQKKAQELRVRGAGRSRAPRIEDGK